MGSSRSWAPRVAVAFALAAVMANGSAATWTQNDAGSGSDASADAASAAQLSRLGAFVGNFTPTDTGDSYFYKTSQGKGPTCTTASVVSDLAVTLHLAAISRGVASQVQATSLPGQRLTVAVASDGFKGAYLGASLDRIPTIMPIRYDFTLDARRGMDMAGPDAGATAMDALPISPGACTGGAIGGGDATDTYRLPLTTATTLVFTFASEASAATMELRNAAGELVGAIASGDALPVTLPPGDTYVTVNAAGASSPSPYTFASGGVGSGPPQEPCEPACLDIMQ